MLRVHDLTLDVIEDLTALLVDAVNAGCTLKALFCKWTRRA
jgi:hypothetical protein